MRIIEAISDTNIGGAGILLVNRLKHTDREKYKTTVLIPKDKFRALQSEQFVEENFQGSLPAFVAAFTSQKSLSKEEYDSLKALVESYGENLK